MLTLHLVHKDQWDLKDRKGQWDQLLDHKDKIQTKILAARKTAHHSLVHKVHNKALPLAHNLQVALHNKHSLHHHKVQAQAKQALVLGQQDQMTTPKAAQSLVAAAQAAGVVHQVTFVPVGHHQMNEAPEETLAAIKGFLR